MNKHILALAVLAGFAGVASAQSSVTIYGSLDMAITKGNGGTAFNQGANGTSEAWQIKQSNASRLGFRGNEDLGGGLSAQFDIQHRFTPDDGAASAILHMYFDRPLPSQRAGVIDHMAFTAQGLKAVKARFDERGYKYDLRRQVGAGTWQLFTFDPNGAKVELDFDPLETL